jgi:hypothetical protein
MGKPAHRIRQLKKRIEIAKDCIYQLRLLEQQVENDDQADAETLNIALLNVRGLMRKWDQDLDRLAEETGQ